MAEERILNDDFFARSQARMALWGSDTIRVTHPSERIRPILEVNKEHKCPASFTKTLLQKECMRLPDAVRSVLGIDTLQNLATTEQHAVVNEVKRVMNQAVARMKTDLELIFAMAQVH